MIMYMRQKNIEEETGPESMHLTLERKFGVINTVQVADWSNRVPAVVVYLPIGTVASPG